MKCAMKIRQFILSALLLFGLTTILNARTIVIQGFDTMKYDVTKITASPGEKLTVTLVNAGNIPKATMGHNWILLKAGEDPIAYANTAITAGSDGFQPKSLSSKVIASIPMLGPKESSSVTFTVPSKPGNYSYLCSFPAHCLAGMRGVLVVK
jgi:azurin